MNRCVWVSLLVMTMGTVVLGDTYYVSVYGNPENLGDRAKPLPAFPGAEGYGSYTPGGHGGRIIEVTNLNDAGPGSLRDALEVQTGPRIVVFRISGMIELSTSITSNLSLG